VHYRCSIFGVTFVPRILLVAKPSLNGFSFLFDKNYKTSSSTTLIPTSSGFVNPLQPRIKTTLQSHLTRRNSNAVSSQETLTLILVTVNFSAPPHYTRVFRDLFLIADVDIPANIYPHIGLRQLMIWAREQVQIPNNHYCRKQQAQVMAVLNLHPHALLN